MKRAKYTLLLFLLLSAGGCLSPMATRLETNHLSFSSPKDWTLSVGEIRAGEGRIYIKDLVLTVDVSTPAEVQVLRDAHAAELAAAVSKAVTSGVVSAIIPFGDYAADGKPIYEYTKQQEGEGGDLSAGSD